MGDPKNKGAAARARYAGSSGANSGFVSAEFINVNLSDSENEDKAVVIPDYATLLNMLQEEVENGYKFTVKWDERGACCACFMQHTEVNHANAGYILAGRGGTPGSAFREVLYVHNRLLTGDWSTAALVKRGRNADDTF